MSELKFGKRIRAVRKNTGCTQKAFCELLNIPQSTLSAYETDRMQPTVATLVNIAEKFNVSLDWLCNVDVEQAEPNDQAATAATSDSNSSDSELYDDLKAALNDAQKTLEELAATHRDEKQRTFLKELAAKRAVELQREKPHK